jgi:cob(I)alamin adenosyltransferase
MPGTTGAYSHSGDDGTTSLGSGQRVRKNALRIEVCGAIDELNSHIGSALAASPVSELIEPLRRIQNELLHLGADLAAPEQHKAARAAPKLAARHVERLEKLIDELNAQLPTLASFILPGGSPAGAQLHVARTVCRRAERLIVALAGNEPVRAENLAYLNRLSDALFVMARFQNHRAGTPESLWDQQT